MRASPNKRMNPSKRTSQAPHTSEGETVGEWKTTSTHDTDIPAQAIWANAYYDAQAWPKWNPEIVSVKLRQPLALGAKAKIRFGNGASMTFTVIEFKDGELFTDEARLPLARMGHRHIVQALPGGGSRLTNTIYIRGPLSMLWAHFLGAKAAAALTDSQQKIGRLSWVASMRPRGVEPGQTA
jgi:Polyketide cyclase / dehydrase and lipid transport